MTRHQKWHIAVFILCFVIAVWTRFQRGEGESWEVLVVVARNMATGYVVGMVFFPLWFRWRLKRVLKKNDEWLWLRVRGAAERLKDEAPDE